MEKPKIGLKVESFRYKSRLGNYLPYPFDLILRDRKNVEVLADSVGIGDALDAYAAGSMAHSFNGESDNRGLAICPVIRR